MSDPTKVPMICEDCGGTLTDDDAIWSSRPGIFSHINFSQCISSLGERLTLATKRAEAAEAQRDALRTKLTRFKGKTRRLYAMLKGQLQGLRRDHARLDWLSDSAQLEGIGIDDLDEVGGCVGMDMYEHASIVAAERGNEGDLTDSDLRKGFRRMIDAAMAVQP